MKSKQLPLFLFYGEEDFLIDEKIAALKQGIVDPAFNIEELSAENFSLESLSNALCGQTLLGGDRLVIVREPEIEPDDQDKFIELLNGMPENNRAIFCFKNIDKRSKLYKFLNAYGTAEEFKTFAPWEQDQLAAWIKQRVKLAGKTIDDRAAGFLGTMSGNNLRLLSKEIEKIVTYIGDRQAIKEEDVAAVASLGEVSAFALLDSLRRNDLKTSLAIFQTLLRNREDLFQLLGLLTTQYRLLLQIRSLPKAERQLNNLLRQVKGGPYFIRKCLEDVDRFSLAKLKSSLSNLLETSLKLKTGEQPAVVFELLLVSLCGA
ncbi:MAG: DNA polymerase III subunit delta [Candidatus Margulisbacteria bacterium]|nr:DNA polymerase III subunit delta [Candidatus Margulisiibacteriota bacterium]